MAAKADVVVARYMEDLEWLAEAMPSDARALIYDKGGGCPPPGWTVEEKLANVGRESHTYLHHIVAHYDALAEVTLFVQGNVEDHVKEIAGPGVSMDTSQFVRRLLDEAATHGLSQTGFRQGGCGLSNFSFHPAGNPIQASGTNLNQWFTATFGGELPGSLVWSVGALFAVRRDRILARPLAFYEDLLAQHRADINPEVTYFLERTWHYLFQS